MKKLLFLSLTVLLGMVSSCKKDSNNAAPAKSASTINELNPSAAFDWSTTQQVTLDVTGQPVPVEIKHLLKVKDQNGVLLFSIYHKMSNNLNIKFDMPADVKKVTIEYGKITKSIDVVAKTIKFKFAPEIGNED
ncbi:hypothetical protein QQ054_03685 [Oscillatoria amoena NRMC-F 0135]|nr:hypothetical protein [Oscillatoria amoena NRMC-F 0135]